MRSAATLATTLNPIPKTLAQTIRSIAPVQKMRTKMTGLDERDEKALALLKDDRE